MSHNKEAKEDKHVAQDVVAMPGLDHYKAFSDLRKNLDDAVVQHKKETDHPDVEIARYRLKLFVISLSDKDRKKLEQMIDRESAALQLLDKNKPAKRIGGVMQSTANAVRNVTPGATDLLAEAVQATILVVGKPVVAACRALKKVLKKSA